MAPVVEIQQMKDNGLSIRDCHYNDCCWPGDAWGQGTSSHGNEFILLENSGFCPVSVSGIVWKNLNEYMFNDKKQWCNIFVIELKTAMNYRSEIVCH